MGVGPGPGCAQGRGPVGRGASVERRTGEVGEGLYVVRPVSALIHGEDCPHFCVWGQLAQSNRVGVH